MPKSKKSAVWKHFKKERDGSAVCKFCNKKLKTSGNTSNLMGHLSRLHKNNLSIPQENARRGKLGGVFSVQQVLANPWRRTEAAGKPSKKNSNRTSRRIKASFTRVIDPTHQRIIFATLLGRRGRIVNPESSSRSSLNSIPNIFHPISDFKAGGKKHIETTNWILSMIIKDNLPMYFVENIGFKQFLHKVFPLYSLPSGRTFTRMLDARYDVQSTIFREKLQSVKFYTLTADIWTDAHQTRSFWGITLHYLEDTNMMTKNLSVYALDNRHTSEYISSIFNTECESWGINRNKILAVVTDNGQNMVKAACDTFGVDNHVHCFANTLNLMAETAIKNEPVISELIERIKRIVTWFKQSCIASDALRR
ncbi:unnamed protein product, partial [Tenebrio molitor]